MNGYHDLRPTSASRVISKLDPLAAAVLFENSAAPWRAQTAHGLCRMFRLPAAVVFAVIVVLSFAFAYPRGPVRLFDGKTFKGWEGNLSFFRIEDGAIVAGTMKDKIPRNEILCKKKQFGDF